MSVRKAALSLSLLLASAPLALAQGTYTQIDYPGAIRTTCNGIDTAGEIVGQYTDSANHQHGFLLSGGVYATIDVPGADDTWASGINDMTQIVGFSAVGNNPVGFVYDLGSQIFTTITYPRAIQTYAQGINNDGTIVGYAYVPRGNGNLDVGFEYAVGVYKTVLPPGFADSYLFAINNSAIAVGAGPGPSGRFVSFLFARASFRAENIPARAATAYGINDQNAVVGTYTLSHTSEGFVTQDAEVCTPSELRLRLPKTPILVGFGST